MGGHWQREHVPADLGAGIAWEGFGGGGRGCVERGVEAYLFAGGSGAGGAGSRE